MTNNPFKNGQGILDIPLEIEFLQRRYTDVQSTHENVLTTISF